MAKIVKMGEGLESNCNLSGKPVKAGETVEVRDKDAQYIVRTGLGRRADASEVAEFLKANGREDEIPKPKAEKKEAKEPAEKSAPKVDEKAPEPKAKAESDGPKTIDEMGFGELKALADKEGVTVTKSKGRVTKADFVKAIKAKKKGK
jgi:hypothetical protein